jgi:hypothetical protein
MRLVRLLLLPLAALVAFSAGLGRVRGEADQAAWLEVGARRLTGAEVLKRWSAQSAHERARYGAEAREQLRHFVEDELVLEMLLAETARVRGLATGSDYQRHKQAVLAEAYGERLRRAEQERGVSRAEIDAFYEAHRALFERPERLRLARILVADLASAEALIEEARRLPSSEAWQTLCRERSLDASSRERGGDLGFVAGDGAVEGGSERVEPALFEAARVVQDGALVDRPVVEGDKFAVVWRRGSKAKVNSSPEREKERIVGYLIEERTRKELARTLSELRRRAQVKFEVGPLAALRLPGAD